MQSDILALGIDREFILLDSELTDLRDLPANLRDDTFFQMLNAVHYELTKLFDVSIAVSTAPASFACAVVKAHVPPRKKRRHMRLLFRLRIRCTC